MPPPSRDCVSPFPVNVTLVLATAVLFGVNRTVTAAVAPVPSVKGLPESMLKGAGTEAVPAMVPVPVLRTVKVRVAELPMVTMPKLTGPGGGRGPPDGYQAEAHGAGGSDGGIALRDGAGDGRTLALLPVSIHCSNRDAVGRASRQPRELEADCLIR